MRIRGFKASDIIMQILHRTMTEKKHAVDIDDIVATGSVLNIKIVRSCLKACPFFSICS